MNFIYKKKKKKKNKLKKKINKFRFILWYHNFNADLWHHKIAFAQITIIFMGRSCIFCNGEKTYIIKLIYWCKIDFDFAKSYLFRDVTKIVNLYVVKRHLEYPGSHKTFKRSRRNAGIDE